MLEDLIVRSAMEGARLRASVGLYRDVATPQTVKDGDKTLNLEKGQHLICNLVSICALLVLRLPLGLQASILRRLHYRSLH